MTAVAARDLFHLYRAPHGDVAALRGLSLDVAEGTAVALVDADLPERGQARALRRRGSGRRAPGSAR